MNLTWKLQPVKGVSMILNLNFIVTDISYSHVPFSKYYYTIKEIKSQGMIQKLKAFQTYFMQSTF